VDIYCPCFAHGLFLCFLFDSHALSVWWCVLSLFHALFSSPLLSSLPRYSDLLFCAIRIGCEDSLFDCIKVGCGSSLVLSLVTRVAARTAYA
jgi:hypothetical protein